MKMKEFFSQFLNDWTKIIWPTRSDVIYSFIMTILLALLFSAFFIVTDKGVSMIVNYILGVK